MAVNEIHRKRDANLKRATLIRMETAKLKRELGTMTPSEALFMCADVIETRGKYESARAYLLIRACPHVGRVAAVKICRAAGVAEEEKLRDIAPERRRMMAFDVRNLADHRKARVA